MLTGWPGTVASVWQQAGRAGRAGQGALAVFIARDDPLDTYLVHHPSALFGRSVEATVLDPTNPYVLAPHLCCAASELPLTEADLPLFGEPDDVRLLLNDLVRRGLLRARAQGWFWTSRERPTADLRGGGGPPVRLVEAGTGRLLGTVDASSSHSQAHTGAVYLHQGETYVVEQLDLSESVALVRRDDPDWSTSARDVTDIRVVEELRGAGFSGVRLSFGTVDVTNQVVSFLRKRMPSGEVLGEEPLDLPARELRTRSVWYTLSPALLAAAGLAPEDVPGRRARGRARRDRAAAAVRDLRPLGHRRRLDRAARGHRRGHRLRLRRAPGRGRLRRARATPGPPPGCAPPGRRSRPASARPAAPRACSRPSAATATSRWTRRGRYGCWTRCCAPVCEGAAQG